MFAFGFAFAFAFGTDPEDPNDGLLASAPREVEVVEGVEVDDEVEVVWVVWTLPK